MSEVKTSILNAPSLDQTVRQLSEHMPQGQLWEAKAVAGTNLNNLMYGVAKPFNITQELIEKLKDELNINTTVDLISEWETSVGLPDDCDGISDNIEQRRTAVIQRFRKVPIVTIDDLQDYVDAKFPDLGIKLYTGTEYFNFEYSFETSFWGNISDKFIIVAEIPSQEPFFEFEFEMEFTGGVNTDFLRCTIERVIPANVVLIIVEVPT
jgi:hypothetical protein